VRSILVVLLAAALAACSTPQSSIYEKPLGKTLVVRKEDWAAYQVYLAKIGSIGQGAFAVPVYGGLTDGFYYVDCPSNHCRPGKAFANDALDDCKHGGGDCVLFAMNREIVVNYRRRP
jgi:hypothetical protein